jgi:TM2 domain-containing membrane protein YozV
MKNKTTAAILAALLGGLGVHNFYLGKTTKGILYLVFCWTGIPAILALIDFIVILTMTDEKFNLEYNSGSALAGVPAQAIPVAATPAITSNVVPQQASMSPQLVETAQDDFITYLKSNAQILHEMIEHHKQNQGHIAEANASSFEDVAASVDVEDVSQIPDKLDAACSNCGQTYKNISAQHKGRTVPCKKCQESMTI